MTAQRPIIDRLLAVISVMPGGSPEPHGESTEAEPGRDPGPDHPLHHAYAYGSGPAAADLQEDATCST